MLTLKTYWNTKFLIALLLTLVHSSSAFTLRMGYVCVVVLQYVVLEVCSDNSSVGFQNSLYVRLKG